MWFTKTYKKELFPEYYEKLSIVRVVTGSARGVRLHSLKGEKTRPIQDRVKESLFSILSDIIPGSRVMDLFAGTGAIGIEALSRGAESCIFVEIDRLAIQTIHKNLEATRLQSKARVLPCDVFEVLPYLEKNSVALDFIFAGPPYPLVEKSDYRDKLFVLLSSISRKNILQPSGIIVVQQRKIAFEIPQETRDCLELFDTRIYGDTQLSFLRNTVEKL